MNVTQIGRCKGCDRFNKLDDGVCELCLNSSKRGRGWAEMSHKCRTDPEFAMMVYDNIQYDEGKRLFIYMYGLPEGAKSPDPIAKPTTDVESETKPVRPSLKLVK